MDFRRGKLYLTLGVTTAGMLFALIWHGWQGWILGKGYPENTFLFRPNAAFSDLVQVVQFASLPNPYVGQFSSSFPAVYVAFRPFGGLIAATSIGLYLTACCFLFFVTLSKALLAIFPEGRLHLIYAAALLLLSYPLWLAVDRANIELCMAACFSLALLCFKARRFKMGLLWILPPVCFKFYPILLTSIFLRSRHLGKIVVAAVVFLIVTYVSLCCFQNPVFVSLQQWSQSIVLYKEFYIIRDGGLAGSASPWNTLKALIFFYSMNYGTTYFSYAEHAHLLYTLYSYIALATLGLVVAITVFIEREFFRRVVLLLILTTLFLPNGSDYRLLYVNMALFVLILIPTRRRWDWVVTFLLAFVTIPKKEIFLPCLGISDSGACDISIGILINPPCMMLALYLLLRDSFQGDVMPYMRQRFLGLARVFASY